MGDAKGYVTRLNGCELHFDPAWGADMVAFGNSLNGYAKKVVFNIKGRKYIVPRPKEFVEPENPNDRARKIAKSIKE